MAKLGPHHCPHLLLVVTPLTVRSSRIPFLAAPSISIMQFASYYEYGTLCRAGPVSSAIYVICTSIVLTVQNSQALVLTNLLFATENVYFPSLLSDILRYVAQFDLIYNGYARRQPGVRCYFGRRYL